MFISVTFAVHNICSSFFLLIINYNFMRKLPDDDDEYIRPKLVEAISE
jgi:hypothetical protein